MALPKDSSSKGTDTLSPPSVVLQLICLVFLTSAVFDDPLNFVLELQFDCFSLLSHTF